ncbi:protein phosphatase 2C domain-containing protein [Spirillospora sp. NPDC047279]|uniref:protein phosphatase 2C domain-containing protein n=1 Tax=Spirillospora sp. NPDC047279 TaxID=3155478 RepID=UPI0033E333FB
MGAGRTRAEDGDEHGGTAPGPAGRHACRECGEPLSARDRFCEACGRPSDLLVAGAAARRRPEARRTCKDCGAMAVGPDDYCDECGLRQAGDREHVELALTADGTVAAAPVSRGMPAAGISDRGLRRSRNEDALALACAAAPVQPPDTPERLVCAVVCDGVATAPGSEAAAQLAADTGVATLVRRLANGAEPEAATRVAVSRAARAVADLPGAHRNAPACTYVSVVVGPRTVTIGWVGDSRAYWLAGVPGRAAPSLLTLDDSWAVRMVARGALDAGTAFADSRAHLLTAWLGADAGTIEPHVTSFTPDGPGMVMACSDGLWHHLPEPGALAATASGGTSPDATSPDAATGSAADPLSGARRLVQAALDAGGHDNVTVALIPFPPEPSRETLR